ncbi:EI24 domain-containing protein [Ralstonia soli]|uniref:EI24 domain-containing protein n=1 Tax=Ralstonia soli TaxID=2953896 RepID=A0ABT1AI91_9RALS|nr:EI24 domain-containing protein [Ralstonia soli]MCO5398014.1 EI24 domain-containing protein [Ralstonia soli]
MNDLIRSFGRALLSQLHPRMLFLTVLPFVVALVVWGGVLYFGWDAMNGVARDAVESWAFMGWIKSGLNAIGMTGLWSAIAPLLVITLLVPVIVVSILVLVSVASVPVVMRFLDRSYPQLERRKGGSVLGSLTHALLCTLVFILVAVITLPLWLIPPFFALIPPLLWGWLTYRLMTYDALADHATAEERRAIMQRYRLPLLGIGIAVGMLGSAPTLLWVSSVVTIVLFPIIAIAVIWLYVLIFIFSALWFGHFCLRALARLRAEAPPACMVEASVIEVTTIELPRE